MTADPSTSLKAGVKVQGRLTRLQAAERPTAGTPFTWLMIVLCSLLLGGLYLDGWAHNHRKLDIDLLSPASLSRSYTPPGLPTTLASWHLLFYVGFLVIAGLLGGVLVRNYFRGHPWRRALPRGYEWSLFGVVMLAIGSAGAVIWPAAFARPQVPGLLIFEALPALLSPLNLIQALGIWLIVSGPLRAAGPRSPAGQSQGWISDLPIVLSLTLLLSLLTYMTQFAHPFVDPWAEVGFQRRGLQTYRAGGQFFFGESLGILSIMLQTALLVGLVLPAVRRWVLPVGSLTVLFTFNAIFMSILQNRYLFIPTAAVAGVVADMLLKQLKASSPRPWEFRLFAFAVPTIYYLFYFLALQYLTRIDVIWGVAPPAPFGLEGIGWSLHLVAGTILLAGAVGWLLSYLVLPS